MKGERVFTTKVTACSIACFWGFDAVCLVSGFTAHGFVCASAHRRVVGVSTFGVLTVSMCHEAGNKTSCSFHLSE